MKFRVKIYVFFVGVAFISVLLALLINYFETRRQVLAELSSNVLTVASIAAREVDPEDIKAIHTIEDMSSEAYVRVQTALQKIRAVNQRDDLYIRYIFIVRPSERNPGLLETVSTASTPPEDVSPIGDLHQNKKMQNLLGHLYENYRPQAFMQDRWGVWLTSFAPVYDAQNKYVATVGANADAAKIVGQLHMLLVYGSIALGISLALALFLAHILSKITSNSLHKLCAGVAEIGKGHLDYHFNMKTKDEFEELSEAINQMCLGLQEKKRLKENFSRYVSEHVMEKILKSDRPLRLEGERRKITVLFSDIRHFTALSEQLAPEKVVGILNEYFAVMLDVIFKNQGTFDKFIGDGIMVEFGSPLDDALQEYHAVNCALEMQERLQKLSASWKKQGKPYLEMGIGIHSGDAVVGNIGTLKRMEYTAIGDTVNVASRIEEETKQANASILVSEITWMKVKNDFVGESLGEISLPGRMGKITVYAVSRRKKKQIL
jgi:adenylate cyclase